MRSKRSIVKNNLLLSVDFLEWSVFSPLPSNFMVRSIWNVELKKRIRNRSLGVTRASSASGKRSNWDPVYHSWGQKYVFVCPFRHEHLVLSLSFQNSFIRRIKGENVFVKHSNLMLEVGMEWQKNACKHFDWGTVTLLNACCVVLHVPLT